MIAEAAEVTWSAIGVVAAIVVPMVTMGVWAGRKSGESAGQSQAIDFQRQLMQQELRHIADDVGEVRRAQAKAEKAASEHRHDDAERFQDFGLWRQWIEGVLASHGLITNVRDTGPHKPTPRQRTPAPSSSEDSR